MSDNSSNSPTVGMAAAATAAAEASAKSSAGVGLVGLEEHCLPEEVRADWQRHYSGGSYRELNELADIHGGRLADMDRYGVEMMVLSLTVDGPQGEPNPSVAQDMAKRANDALAKIVARRPDRFAAFGCLAMQDVDVACREFERVVGELGMCGVMLNNVQRNGPDADSVLFYDLPQYDAFWETAQRLNAPAYLHPGWPTPARQRDIAGFYWLNAATWEFSAQTGTHALRIITSGVFDRYPGAQLILGHNGEHIVGDMWRIHNRIKIHPRGYRAKQSVRSYFRSNVHITTSGQFSTPYLRQCISEIGADRVMFSIDTPYEKTSAGAPWFRSAEMSPEERIAIGRGNAIRLLKLPLR